MASTFEKLRLKLFYESFKAMTAARSNSFVKQNVRLCNSKFLIKNLYIIYDVICYYIKGKSFNTVFYFTFLCEEAIKHYWTLNTLKPN